MLQNLLSGIREDLFKYAEALGKFAEAFASGATDVLLAFAAIGALTMAILQTAKDQTTWRRSFNRGKTATWLGESVEPDKNGTEPPHPALDALVGLATAGDGDALFDLEIERVAGLIAAAGGIVVDYPQKYPALFSRLAVGARQADVEKLLEDKADGRAKLERLRKDDAAAFDELLDAKTRVTHQIQRNVDAFMISTAFRWKTMLQRLSFAISFVLASFAIVINGSDWRAALVMGPLAGYFAPIARDVIHVLNQARRTV